MNNILKTTLIASATLLILTGCKPETSVPPTENSVKQVEAPQTQAPVANPADGLNDPIAVESLSVNVEAVGQPTYIAASDSMRVKLRVANNSGTGFLVSNGAQPINLGVMLIGPEGPDKAPGVRDFARISLPMTPAGSTVEVFGDLPAKSLLGMPVRVEMVQENVRWFENIGIDLGVFNRCKGNEASLCDDKGTVLVTE